MLLALLVPAVVLRAQPPSINQESVVNEASRIPPSLPGGALTPGTRIAIAGFRFGRSPHVRLTSPEQNTELRVLSSTPEQIEALLPDAFPSGAAQLTVSNEDGPSRPFRVRIVPGALGLYTENGAGWGPAKIVFAADRRITLLATGSARARRLQIFVGGKRAHLVSLDADAREPGMERLEFEIPAKAPSGCHVPVVVRAPDGLASNAVTIPVGNCNPNQQDPFAGASPGEKSALILLARLHVVPLGTGYVTEDFGAGVFAPVETEKKILNPYRLMPPEGTCTTYTGRYTGDFISTLLPSFSEPLARNTLEAGAELSIAGPAGKTVAQRKRAGVYARIIGFERFMTTTSRPLFLSPGAYTVSWRGGAEVPAFGIPLTMPAPISWTNESKLAVVNRNRDLTLKWRPGGMPHRAAVVAVNVDPNTTALATCFCLAPKGSSAFTIPAMMLANLPETSEQDRPAVQMSMLALIPLDDLERFRAPGLEIRALTTAAQARLVKYR